MQQKGDGTQRLVSVCQSFGISEDPSGNIRYGDKKFLPPRLGLDQIYFVTERGIQLEVKLSVKLIFQHFDSPPFRPRRWLK